MVEWKYVVSAETHAEQICAIVRDLVAVTDAKPGFNTLRHQFKLYKGQFDGSRYADNKTLQNDYQIDTNPEFSYFSNSKSSLSSLGLKEVDSYESCDLSRRLMQIKSNDIPAQRLRLKFECVDTEELKDIEIKVEGDRAIYKIGEGETSHFHIPNDKKLWETQFMVCSIGGQFYLRDMGFVHNSRVKLDTKCEVQIQKGSVVDLGKVVHYHFDKVCHNQKPTEQGRDKFYILTPDKDYEVDKDDVPYIRARPIWISADENPENIQNEIHVNTDGQKVTNTVGRSMRRDIQIKLKAVSADHCQI